MRKTELDKGAGPANGYTSSQDTLKPVEEIHPDDIVDAVLINGRGPVHDPRKVTLVFIAGDNIDLIWKRDLRIRDNECREQRMCLKTGTAFHTTDVKGNGMVLNF